MADVVEFVGPCLHCRPLAAAVYCLEIKLSMFSFW